MLALLKKKLGDQIQLSTPEDSSERGATLVFQVKGVKSNIIVSSAVKLSSVRHLTVQKTHINYYLGSNSL